MTTLKEQLDLAEAKLSDARAKYAKAEKACTLAYNAYEKVNEQFMTEELSKGDNIPLLLNARPPSKVAYARLAEICKSYGLDTSGEYFDSGQHAIRVIFDKNPKAETNAKQIEGLNFFLPHMIPVSKDDNYRSTKDSQSLVGCKRFDILEHTCSEYASFSGAIAPNGDVLLVTYVRGKRTVENVGTFDKIITNHYMKINGKYVGDEAEEDDED